MATFNLKALKTSDVFALANEVDTGQDTSNPYILARRAATSGQYDLDTLNAILSFNGISVTQQEVDFLNSIKPVLLPKLPFPANDELVTSTIGTASKRGKQNPVCGVYMLENLDGSSKYVGSSSILAMRIRQYVSAKGMAESRPVAKALREQGLANFNIYVYVIDPRRVALLGTSLTLNELTLAFEQMMILTHNPILNSLYVVNGVTPGFSPYKPQGKAVFIYNRGKDTLLYTAESQTRMENEIGMSAHSMNRSIRSGTAMYGKYVFTPTLIEGATTNLMSPSDLRKDLADCYRNRAQLRDYSKPAGNMIPIILTDLATNTIHVLNSKRRACRYTLDYPKDRQVDYLEVIRFKLPFEFKGWHFRRRDETKETPKLP